MAVTGGMKIFDKSKALLSDGASMVVSSGEGSKEFALAGNQNRFLRTTQSGDLIEESFSVAFGVPSEIDRLILRNHNFKNYSVQYWDGSQWREFSSITDIDGNILFVISETAYAKDTSYYEFAAITTTKIRVLVTSIQSIPSVPTSGAFFAGMTRTKDGTWSTADGDLTGTLNGSAVISAGFLNLDGALSGDYLGYLGTNNANGMVQTFAASIKYTPNYAGSPAADRPILDISKAVSDADNLIQFYHESVGGGLRLVINDSAGVLVKDYETPAWVPVSGTEYELSFEANLTLGYLRIYVDGVQLGVTSYFAKGSTRDSLIDLIQVGRLYDDTGTPNGKYRALKLFNDEVFKPEICLLSTFGIDEDADESKGDPDGVLTGAAVVSGGELDMSAGGYLTYLNPGNGGFEGKFQASFRVTPIYTGSPTGGLQALFYRGNDLDNVNNCILYHSSGGDLFVEIRDLDAVLITSTNLGAWAPTSGVQYAFEFQVDVIDGATKLFIDGVQFGSTIVATGDRSGAGQVTVIRTGKSKTTDSGTADFKIDDFKVTPFAGFVLADFPDIYAEKFINQFIPTKEIGTFSGYPVIAGPIQERNARIKKMLSGQRKIQKSEDSVSMKIKFVDYPANNAAYSNDVDILLTLFDSDDPFLIWLCGGRSGSEFFGYTNRGWRLRDIYQMGIVSGFDMRYLRNIFKNPVSFNVSIAEAL